MTRELWLHMLTDLLSEHYARKGHRLPENIRFSCGWTSSRKAAGECWSQKASADGTFEIFVSPVYDDSLAVAGILTHELAHVASGVERKHGRLFRQCCRDVGLEGNPSSAIPGQAFNSILDGFITRLVPYPHAELARSDRKKDTTRMIKLVCPGCGYTVRTTQKWIEKGLPLCYCEPDELLSFQVAGNTNGNNV
ncbi:hypothetical protein ES703_85846 [subsurface metagenome]